MFGPGAADAVVDAVPVTAGAGVAAGAAALAGVGICVGAAVPGDATDAGRSLLVVEATGAAERTTLTCPRPSILRLDMVTLAAS